MLKNGKNYGIIYPEILNFLLSYFIHLVVRNQKCNIVRNRMIKKIARRIFTMSELDNNIRKRENFTANIIFSIVFGIGSFIFYKMTGETMWAIFLFIASVILLFCYSSILQLEEENIELNNAIAEEENEEEEYIDEEEIEEERRALFEKNVGAFKK